MNPDQSDLGPYCLQHRLPKNISRQESWGQKLLLGTKGKSFQLELNYFCGHTANFKF